MADAEDYIDLCGSSDDDGHPIDQVLQDRAEAIIIEDSENNIVEVEEQVVENGVEDEQPAKKRKKKKAKRKAAATAPGAPSQAADDLLTNIAEEKLKEKPAPVLNTNHITVRAWRSHAWQLSVMLSMPALCTTKFKCFFPSPRTLHHAQYHLLHRSWWRMGQRLWPAWR